MEKQDTPIVVLGERTASSVDTQKGPRGYYQRHIKDGRNWVPIFAQIHDHSMYLSGKSAKDFYYNATSFVDAQLAVQSYYRFDIVSFSDDMYNFEAEALGARMIYGDDSMPTVDFREPLIKKPADLLHLRTPDFFKDGRMSFKMEVLRQTRELGFNKVNFCAPFSLAVMLRSYPLLIRDMRKDPAFVNGLFTFLVDEVLIPYFRHIHHQRGITIFSGADAWAAFPNMSVKLLEEWVLPWNLHLMKKGSEIGINTSIVATADYCEEELEKFDAATLRKCLEISVASQGAPVLFLGMGCWQDYPLDPVLKYAHELKSQGRRVTILGGINARILRNGPVKEIIRNVKRMIDAFAGEFQLAVWLSNIPADTPPGHVHAAVQATHYYGKTPYQFRDDDVSFQPELRESYGEFTSKIDLL